jgi:hypothetical protein
MLPLLLFFVVNAYEWPSDQRPLNVEYQRKYMDMYKDDWLVWQGLSCDYQPAENHIYKIDA